MLQILIPKLPARDIEETKSFYVDKLSFNLNGLNNDYLIVAKDNVEIHFYQNKNIKPTQSDKMIYLRVSEKINTLYEEFIQKGVQMAQLGKLEKKPWGQTEFSIIDNNGTLLTFGQAEKQ
jgi:uncharacterized glyoxalase superfamily protein PhnB